MTNTRHRSSRFGSAIFPEAPPLDIVNKVCTQRLIYGARNGHGIIRDHRHILVMLRHRTYHRRLTVSTTLGAGTKRPSPERVQGRAAENGMETFGFHKGSFATNREQCYPTQEYQSCLVRFGDEVTTRLLEGIHAAFVALCISEDKIPPLELEPAGFSVAGVLACGSGASNTKSLPQRGFCRKRITSCPLARVDSTK